MRSFMDRIGHPYRAAEAWQRARDATNPRVRTIQREIAQRYGQLASIPNDAPVEACRLDGDARDEVQPPPVPRRDAARWQEDRTVGPATPGGCEWENEGGAPRGGQA